jgi:hypothetical protein
MQYEQIVVLANVWREIIEQLGSNRMMSAQDKHLKARLNRELRTLRWYLQNHPDKPTQLQLI